MKALKAPAAGPALAALLVVTGVTHFVAPQFYDALIPKSLPGAPRTWVLASGGVELACAAALANRRSRRVGATLAIVLFLGVFPANIQMAIDWRHDGWLKATIAYARLPLQVPLIYWALWVRREAGPDRQQPASLHPARPRRPWARRSTTPN